MRVGHGCGLAAMFPAGAGPSRNHGTLALAEAVDGLTAYWERAGFVPWGEGISLFALDRLSQSRSLLQLIPALLDEARWRGSCREVASGSAAGG